MLEGSSRLDKHMTQDNQNKLPDIPPLIANGDSNRGYYVCTYQNRWDADRKRSVRVSSTSVGRVQGKEKYGLIEFYEEFLRQYPGLKRYHVYRSDGPQRLVFIPKLVRRKKDLEAMKSLKNLRENLSMQKAESEAADSSDFSDKK